MCMCHKSSAFVLVPILFIGQASSVLINYGDVLENQMIDDQFRFLGPEGLLENHRIAHENNHRLIMNENCSRDLVIYQRAIDQRQSWAMKMLDASSKLPVGVLQGHVVDMGMFDECIEARGQSNDFDIHGRHCMYAINPTAEKHFVLNPTLSICLPASCNAHDVVGLLNDTINTTEQLKILGINVVSASCTALPSNDASMAFLVSFTITVVYIAFLLFCTFCDLASRKYQINLSGTFETFQRFSLLKNAEAIFNTTTQNSNLPVIHGIRAISTCWIVLVHEYLVQFLGVNVNVVYITEWFTSWGSLYPLLGLLSVDTFLALSGFLMTYNFFNKISKTNDFNIPLYYLHRFVRLTFPVVSLTVATFVLIPGFGSGARYEWLQNVFVTGCGSKWWSVLLYIQNFMETDNYCLLHLWSLSVDMQLYWVSPFVLYPLYKRPRLGLSLVIVLIMISAILSGSIVAANKYSSIYFSHDYNMTRVMEAFQNVYQMTYTRASPWLIGIIFAYVMTNETPRPNKLVNSIGWLLAIASFTFCTLGIRYFTDKNYEYNLSSEVTFAILQRPLWAFGICWIIYASTNDSSGPIARLLSSKIFLPISKLSYSIYLVHIILPMFQVGTSRTPKYFNQYSIFQSYISDMILAIVIAFFFSLIFEIPILILEDVIFKRRLVNPSKIADRSKTN